MMRVAIGGILHETCTYADETAGMTGATAFHCMEGQQIMQIIQPAQLVNVSAKEFAAVLEAFHLGPSQKFLRTRSYFSQEGI